MRLNVLQHRDDLLNSLFDDVETKLITVKNDREKHEKLLSNLSLEVLYKFMESKVEFHCKSEDEKILDQIITSATRNFENKTTKNVKIDIIPDLDVSA